mmetsp:Transcript_5881/g.12567  ORF Transcript_5881/g.12567 Transcript_5881/m.12567 type:complete len:322 (+) Transcript_5881:1642-2607(+)
MPGTHWYHPHFHGSTTLQTGQGVAGMIIVDDPDGYLPDPIANMPEINLMIQHMDLENLQEAAGASGSVLWKEGSIDYGNATTETGNTNLLLVNMQYVPKISVERGRWYRMRMVLSSVQEGLAWEAPEGCTLQLLAKDGIYLSDAPRTVETMILAPGNRADVAIRCDAEPGVYKMPAVSRVSSSTSTVLERGDSSRIENEYGARRAVNFALVQGCDEMLTHAISFLFLFSFQTDSHRDDTSSTTPPMTPVTIASGVSHSQMLPSSRLQRGPAKANHPLVSTLPPRVAWGKKETLTSSSASASLLLLLLLLPLPLVPGLGALL